MIEAADLRLLDARVQAPMKRTKPHPRASRRRTLLAALAMALIVVVATSCGSVRYYSQAIGGGARLLAAREPIEKLIEKGGLDPQVEKKLLLVTEIRTFASERLELPVNKSYRSYVELDRPFVSWNVTAAPPLSVEPRLWCFLVVGCVSYRGYFEEEKAKRYSARLHEEQGLDVAVGGVRAYSTLGWFADPVLSTFLELPDAELAGLLFHELAHQRVYLKGDTAFNESFATAVELVGVERWLEDRGRAEEIEAYRELHALERDFAATVLETRDRLAEVYAENRPDEWKMERKETLLRELREEWERKVGEEGPYSDWFDRPLNNAHLAQIGAYFEWVPAFASLLESVGGDLAEFYRRVDTLAELPPEERESSLDLPAW